MGSHGLELDLHPTVLAVCRLSPDAPVPGWLEGADSPLISVIRTGDELSIVAPADLVPQGNRVEAGWRAMAVRGPLEFSMVGILAALAQPLADAEVPIFVLSTYDTDWILVPEERLEAALTALRSGGHEIRERSRDP